MAIGFFKKMFFADNIAPMVNEIFNVPYWFRVIFSYAWSNSIW